MNYNFKTTSNTLLFGLALVASCGILMMITALAAGVNVDEATGNLLLFLFLGGLVFLVLGIGAWLAFAQPFKHFDDINQPAEDDHGHGHAAHSDETALVAHDDSAVVAHSTEASHH